MTAHSFIDTNVLDCADDKVSPARQRRALEFGAEDWLAGTGAVSLKVLREYFGTSARKLRREFQIRGAVRILN